MAVLRARPLHGGARPSRAALFGLAVLLACLSAGASARAEPRAYRGPHPLDEEGGWHAEEAIHVHDELPVGLAPFAEVDGALVFLGDPQAFGFEGRTYDFEGTHPLPARVGALCGLEGRHRHWFAPEGSYRRVDGAYRFAGALRGGMRAHVPERVAPARGPREVRAVSAAPLGSAQPAWVDGAGQPLAAPVLVDPYGCGTFTETLADGSATTFAWGACPHGPFGDATHAHGRESPHAHGAHGAHRAHGAHPEAPRSAAERAATPAGSSPLRRGVVRAVVAPSSSRRRR